MSLQARQIFDRLITVAVAATGAEGVVPTEPVQGQAVAALPGGATLAFEEASAGEGTSGTREACIRIGLAPREAPASGAAPTTSRGDLGLPEAVGLPALMTVLRDDPALRFDFLQNLTAVDWIKRDTIEVVYHLFSYPHRHAIAVKVDLPRAAPRVPSVASVWPTADWMEREQFDLLGVVFLNHPDLRRLLMPDDWVGHPMRKDYHEPRSYRGMPTSRPSPLDLLSGYDRAHRAQMDPV
jgi:NADH-quinone oxidoreductase subunit C